MKPERPNARDPVEAFAEFVRQVRPALPARKRAAGWQRLAQAMASNGPLADEPTLPSSSRSLRWGITLALAGAAVLIPIAWRAVKGRSHEVLEYTVAGSPVTGGSGTRERSLAAPTAPVELRFTDGSRVSMRVAARLTVAALKADGCDIRLLDGAIDVDVRHRPATAWRFVAGPYTVDVKGTSFTLAWSASGARLDLQMRSGAVALLGPESAMPRTVAAGDSVSLGGSRSPPDGSGAAPSPPSPPIAPAMPEAPVPRAHREHVRANAPATSAHSDWEPLLARGDFSAIVDEATRKGIDACLAADTAANLSALADAARYTRRSDLARRSLLALRARFRGTERARDASFFLGRLAETTSSRTAEAINWYELYLSEKVHGIYTEEALGREMILLHRNGAGEETRRVARRYLDAYPHGSFADQAAAWSGTPSMP